MKAKPEKWLHIKFILTFLFFYSVHAVLLLIETLVSNLTSLEALLRFGSRSRHVDIYEYEGMSAQCLFHSGENLCRTLDTMLDEWFNRRMDKFANISPSQGWKDRAGWDEFFNTNKDLEDRMVKITDGLHKITAWIFLYDHSTEEYIRIKRRRRRIFTMTAFFVLLALLIAIPFWCVYRDMRQARLDHALIAAIKVGDDKRALEALAEGASGEARDTGKSPTYREVLRQMLNRFRHPGTPSAKQTGDDEHMSALLLLYQTFYNKPITITSEYDPGPSLAVIRTLLDNGARINESASDGYTPLGYAAQGSNVEAVSLLLTRGANIEADCHGWTPLMVAEHAGVAEVLLKHRANIEAKNSAGRTPLFWAAYHDNLDLMRILLEYGAKTSSKDAFGHTALDCVRGGGQPNSLKIAALLRKYGAK